MSHSSSPCLCGRCAGIINQCRLERPRDRLPNLLDVFGYESSPRLHIALSAIALDSDGRAIQRERSTEDYEYILRCLTPTSPRQGPFPFWIDHDHVLRRIILQSRARPQTNKYLYRHAAWLPLNDPSCRDGPFPNCSGDRTRVSTDSGQRSAPSAPKESPRILPAELAKEASHGRTRSRKEAHPTHEGSTPEAIRLENSKRALHGGIKTEKEAHPTYECSMLGTTRSEDSTGSCHDESLGQNGMEVQEGQPIVAHRINRLSTRHQKILADVQRRRLHWLSQLPSDPPSSGRDSLSSNCPVSPLLSLRCRTPKGVAAQSSVVDEVDNPDIGFGGFKKNKKFDTEKQLSVTRSHRKNSRPWPMPPAPLSDQAVKSNGHPIAQHSNRERATAGKRRRIEVDMLASTAGIASGDNLTPPQTELESTHRYNLRKRSRIR